MAIVDDAIDQAVNNAYDDFTSIRLPAVYAQVNRNQDQNTQDLDAAYGRRSAELSNQEAQMGGMFNAARQRNAANTQWSARNMGDSIAHAVQAFGNSPLSMPNGPSFNTADIQPGLNRLADRSIGAIQSAGANANRELGYREDEMHRNAGDYQQRLSGWKRDMIARAQVRYANQRMAIEREMIGANLERKLALANMAASLARGLQTTLTAINNTGGR